MAKNYVVQTSKGTIGPVERSDANAIAKEEAGRLKEIVAVRLGQQVLHYVNREGILSPRQALLYRIEVLRSRLADCMKVANNLKEQDIVDALFAAEVQFEDLEEVPK